MRLHKNKLLEIILPGLLAVSLLGVYLITMAPGLTWANYGADGGDLATAAATGGVAHPTGYPVYLLLARLFQFLPIGSLAFRTNLLSAFCTMLAALLVYELVFHGVHPLCGRGTWFAALASGCAFGLAPLIWSQAVITEVYGLHVLFVAAVLFLSTVDIGLLGQKNQDRCLGLVLGLAIGNHVTSVLLLPILLFGKIYHQGLDSMPGKSLITRWRLDIQGLVRRMLWLATGLLVYISIPLRALTRPPVNWGNPLTLSGFTWLVSGKLYQDELFVLTLPSVWERCKVVAALLLGQFGIIGLAIGLIGLVVFFKSSPIYRDTLWVAVAFTIFSILYATNDSFLYLNPVFLCFAVWIGMGILGLMSELNKFYKSGLAIGLIFILVLSIQTWNNWPQVDASHDQRAEQFGRDVLNQAPAHAIVFAKGDRAVFTLWYFHFALQERSDLSVVAVDLLHFDWYQQNLLGTYRDLNVPDPFPFAETIMLANPERPVCYVEYIQLPQIQCLPVNSH